MRGGSHMSPVVIGVVVVIAVVVIGIFAYMRKSK